MRALIVGMGIGELYKSIYERKLWDVTTVDQHKPADYWDIEEVEGEFDVAHICTPNWTHGHIARIIASRCKIVFVEKPGLRTAEHWEALVHTFPNTRFCMVKNNQFRHNVAELYITARKSDEIVLNWHNYNRVPNPGSWFTDKSRAWGGVSRDLLPHLLSWVQVFEPEYSSLGLYSASEHQHYTLDTVGSTDYGVVDPEGVYDVDDTAELLLNNDWHIYTCTTSWKNPVGDKINIEFFKQGDLIHIEPLGLCPEDAYEKMVDTAVDNLYNDRYWSEQFARDVWIHKQLELF
tara:strand:+ start:238 stop:1110 length:873 start_codon:yes stop_codon:yes gene_type:complete